jgi:hypothetical protein
MSSFPGRRIVLRPVIKTRTLVRKNSATDLYILLECIPDKICGIHMLRVEVHGVYVTPCCAVNDSADSGPDTRDRAHAAWLKRDVKRTTRKVDGFRCAAELAKSNDLRMGRWVVPQFRLVVPRRNHHVAFHDYAADFSGPRSQYSDTRRFKRETHKLLVTLLGFVPGAIHSVRFFLYLDAAPAENNEQEQNEQDDSNSTARAPLVISVVTAAASEYEEQDDEKNEH